MSHRTDITIETTDEALFHELHTRYKANARPEFLEREWVINGIQADFVEHHFTINMIAVSKEKAFERR